MLHAAKRPREAAPRYIRNAEGEAIRVFTSDLEVGHLAVTFTCCSSEVAFLPCGTAQGFRVISDYPGRQTVGRAYDGSRGFLSGIGEDCRAIPQDMKRKAIVAGRYHRSFAAPTTGRAEGRPKSNQEGRIPVKRKGTRP